VLHGVSVICLFGNPFSVVIFLAFQSALKIMLLRNTRVYAFTANFEVNI
jgi:hypothetical protein